MGRYTSLISLFITCSSYTSAFATPPSQQVLSSHSGYHDVTPAFPSKPYLPPGGFVAIGDSYSAGIGTGTNGSEGDCRLGLHSYPRLIYNDLAAQFHEPSFQHLSCTGATINDALAGAQNSQIDHFNSTCTADFALLSIGGNDLGFFDIMNSCIFRFFSFYSGTCEEALKKSDEAMASPDFEQHLRLLIMEILDRVHWEKRPWFKIYVTGYARFFNAETKQCDDASMGIWWRGPKLKRNLRRRVNTMVKDVNRHIKKSIHDINKSFTADRVYFVDYDDAFDGHRFCEPGVSEPDDKRNETWFFHVGGHDSEGGSSDDDSDVDKCWGLKGEEKEKCLAHQTDVSALNGMWYVPTYYGKTFHPRTAGHMAIRDKIYELWEKQRPLS